MESLLRIQMLYRMKGLVKSLFKLMGFNLIRNKSSNTEFSRLYEKYIDFTMVPKETFIMNLELCNDFKERTINYVECGVWRGGMSSAIAEYLGQQVHVHLFDSFEGLPVAKPIDGEAALTWQADKDNPNYFDNCKANESYAINAMQLANHKNYTLHKGWFDQTLPKYEGGPISILRLDGDWYDSIFVCFEYLYPHVVEGGIIILDDYYVWDGCSKATHDYLSKIKSSSKIRQFRNSSIAFIKKTI